jgi:curved DNA-binding protein
VTKIGFLEVPYSLGVKNILERFMHYQDYCKIPAISSDATAEEIRKSFHKLARKYYPDVSHEKDAEGRMKGNNEAYAALSDPEKFAAYDRVGQGYQ